MKGLSAVTKLMTAVSFCGMAACSIYLNKNMINSSLLKEIDSADAPLIPPTPKSTPIDDFSICQTSSWGWEVIFESLLGSIFREEGFLPKEGSVLDVGSQFGEQACHFALLAPSRTVHAMDPSPKNIQKILDSSFGSLPNLKTHVAGVGKEVGVMKPRDKSFQMNLDAEFRVETLDSMFYDKGEKLAFAHIDVEGPELDTLKGGVQTIKANLPVFTTELRVHKDPKYSRELLDFINGLGHDSYVVDEVCGFPHMDFRNILNVPRKLSGKLTNSDAFALGLATEAMFRVDSESIFRQVYPCCAIGGECCPGGDPDAKECCGTTLVNDWLQANGQQRRVASKDWKAAHRVTHARQNMLLRRAKMK